jgi:predicted GIY-YIG superfamily endonuclease
VRTRRHVSINYNDGLSKWTRNKGSWTLVWISEKSSITQARKLENGLKRQKGGNGFFQKTGLTRPKGS